MSIHYIDSKTNNKIKQNTFHEHFTIEINRIVELNNRNVAVVQSNYSTRLEI